MSSPQVARFAEASAAAVAAPMLHKSEAIIRALAALGEVLADFDSRVAAIERRLAQLG